jgi:hypothetical protein
VFEGLSDGATMLGAHAKTLMVSTLGNGRHALSVVTQSGVVS